MLWEGTVAGEGVWCGVEREADHDERCARLHRKLRRIVKARAALDAEEAEALREAERLRVWRHYGYASLVEYMELEMGYTPRAALERLRVAKAIVELPAIAEAMTQGDLSFSAVRELTRVATAETEGEWLAAAEGKNLREVEDLVSGHTPGTRPSDPADPSLRKRVLRYEVNAEEIALERQVRAILEQERGERLSDKAFINAVFRCVLERGAGGDRDRAPYQVASTVCTECKRGWQDGGGLTVEMSPPAVERALCDAEHVGSLDGTGTERAKQAIPPATRRKVKRRDHGRCRVPGCRSSRNLDLHHIVPRERGGTNEPENLITLCEGHHLAHHEGALLIEGTASNATFTRRAHNAFTIAKHAVDTASALKQLGFKPHEVKAAIDKTRTHVGTAELTLEHWLKIALGYCPKPR